MKLIVLYLIKLYKILLPPFIGAMFPTTGCRFYPTCSLYTYNSVEKCGAAKGLWLGAVRVLKCNPWN